MEQGLQILGAFGLMAIGFILVALIYFMRNNNWNGYADKTKLLVASGIMLIVAILLIVEPEMAGLIKEWLALNIDIEHSKKGFVVFGFTLSLFLNMAYKSKK